MNLKSSRGLEVKITDRDTESPLANNPKNCGCYLLPDSPVKHNRHEHNKRKASANAQPKPTPDTLCTEMVEAIRRATIGSEHEKKCCRQSNAVMEFGDAHDDG